MNPINRRTLLTSAGAAGLTASTRLPSAAAAVAAPLPWQVAPVNRAGTYLVALAYAGGLWAVGRDVRAGYEKSAPLILRRTQSGWRSVPHPVSGLGDLEDIDGSSTNLWAVGTVPRGTTSRPLVLHWDGSRWSEVAPPTEIGGLGTVAVVGDEVLVGGWARVGEAEHAVVYRRSGSTWLPMFSGLTSAINTNVLLVRSSSDIWAALNPGLAHFDGTSWTPEPSVPADGSQIIVSLAAARGTVWGAGVHYAGAGMRPLVLRKTGSAWNRLRVPQGVHGQLSGIADSPVGMLAVGERFDANLTGTGLVLSVSKTSTRVRNAPRFGDGLTDIIDVRGKTWTSVYDSKRLRSAGASMRLR